MCTTKRLLMLVMLLVLGQDTTSRLPNVNPLLPQNAPCVYAFTHLCTNVFTHVFT
jgi:hypothetical protein